MATIDISKPLFAKVYDFDDWDGEPEGSDNKGKYVVRQVWEIHLTGTYQMEPFIWLSNGMQSHTFEFLPQEE